MMINSFFSRKYSVADILIVFTFFVVSFFIFTFKVQIDDLNTNVLTLQTQLSSLKNDNLNLMTMLSEKNEQIKELQLQISKTTSDATLNADVIMHKNNMTQFYIKTLGVVLVIVASGYVINSVGIFDFKSEYLNSLYYLIQDNTSFFQLPEKVFVLNDCPKSKTQWLVKLINERHLEIWVKGEYNTDYLKVDEFISKLQLDSRMIVEVAKSSLQEPESAQQLASLITKYSNYIM